MYVTFSGPIMNVLLLRPVPANERFGLGPFFRIEPLGMEYIAAALEARGHRVTLADLRFSRGLASQMRASRPALVGIAAMHALETDEVLALAQRVRALAPEVPILVGGHTAAAYPDPFLAPETTAVVVDDGERALPRVCDALERGESLTTVRGSLGAALTAIIVRTAGGPARSPSTSALPARRHVAPWRRRCACLARRPAWLVRRAAVRSAARSADLAVAAFRP
jgi:radical SAM superfamily enzyme YgiQ (UPF0313 family)